ncbi:MAG: 50S ribosomal protein L9 [Patescibacteria group bacterium]
MKVIFSKDVPRVGKKNDVKEVNDGYAINFLFPNKLAERASSSSLRELEKRQKEILIERELEESLLIKNLGEIEGKKITLKGKANDKGHLFSAIHKKEILEAMKNEHKIEIDEDFLVLEKPIKEIGEFNISIKVKNKKSFLKLRVEEL